MKFIDELIELSRDVDSRLHICMQTLKEPTVGDTAKSYFYGESLYLESMARRLDMLMRLYRDETKGRDN